MTGADMTVAPSLAAAEAVIRRGLVESAAALRAIRDGRLYREAGFSSFEAYCRERLGIGRNRADQIVAAGDVVRGLPTTVGTAVTNEAQARALAAVPVELRAELLDEVAAAGAVTATAITRAWRERQREARALVDRVDRGVQSLLAQGDHALELAALPGTTPEVRRRLCRFASLAGQFVIAVGEADLDRLRVLTDELAEVQS